MDVIEQSPYHETAGIGGGNRAKGVLLTGVPRSGTSLGCRLAGGLPDTLALSEPLDLGSIERDDRHQAVVYIRDTIEHMRARILSEGRGRSFHVQGRLDDQRVEEKWVNGLRPPRGERGDVVVAKPLSENFTLMVKHNALFAALLPELQESIPYVAVVRNPLAVLASWQTVALPIHDGRVPEGEQFDGRLRLALDQEPDVWRRQLIILNWLFEQYGSHVFHGNILRYEDIVGSGGRVLYNLLGHPDHPPETLKNMNDNALYGKVPADDLLDVLLDSGGAWMQFYSGADCRSLAEKIMRGRHEHQP